MTSPKVSVIMAVYNAENYLKESIESILNQTFQDLELIIVNDGSTDNSLSIIKSYNDKRIILIDQKNSGAAISRNNAIEIASSNYIAILDADDIALSDRLGKQYQFLSANPDYIILGSNAHVIDMEGNYIYDTELKETDEQIKEQLPEMPFVHPSVMFRKNVFNKAGKYPDRMLVAQDAVLLNRMATFGKVCNLNECFIKYRIVPTANSSRNPKENADFKNFFNKAISNQKISDQEYESLKKITNNRNSKNRMVNYHLFIAKKFLWNNYKPKMARRNLVNAFKLNPSITIIFLFILSLSPKKIVQLVYRKFK